MKLTDEQWSLSQKNEAGFWDAQTSVDNIEQRQRNQYYRGPLEDGNTIAKDFFAMDFTQSTIMDIGSGPEGILHVLKAKYKLVIDPLMATYIEQGYDVTADNVRWLPRPAETFRPCMRFDYGVCLNALDHMKDPAEAILNMSRYIGKELLLLTDLRTEEQLDDYHRLAVSEEDVISWLEPYFEITHRHNFPHQAGNPVRQLVVRCKRLS